MNKFISRLPVQSLEGTFELFSYNSGRWLWNEQYQLKLRSRKFNPSSLQQAASQATGGLQYKSLVKIGEGNYNKAFALATDNGEIVIAKMPHPNAGPALYTTASEVATMTFARDVPSLPVPKVLAWSADAKNPVGAEYIIMEEARGSPLHEVWKTLTLRAKCSVVERVVEIERRLSSVSLNKVGSLYFNDGCISGCQPLSASIDADVLDDEINSKFCIGPIARKEFWGNERLHMNEYHGPWNTPAEYLISIANREIDWISHYATQHTNSVNSYAFYSHDQRSQEAHVKLLRKFLAIAPDIVPKDPQIASSCLWHPDFHPGNIFVDDKGGISSIIDWQGSWLTPVFIGPTPPQFLDYGVEMLMKLPDNFMQLDESMQSQLRTQVSESIMITTYEKATSKRNPRMYKMMRHNHGQTLKHLEAFVGTTWEETLFPLQQTLINVEREWEFFDTETPCPYEFSEDEMEAHNEDVDAFNEYRESWRSLREHITDEGYAANEDFA